MLYLGICLTLVMMSCAPSRYVRPLDKGEVALNVHAFGPLIKFGGAVVPVPLTSVGVGYGLRNNLTLHGTVHTTAALYGTIQTRTRGNLFSFKTKEIHPRYQCGSPDQSFRRYPCRQFQSVATTGYKCLLGIR